MVKGLAQGTAASTAMAPSLAFADWLKLIVLSRHVTEGCAAVNRTLLSQRYRDH
jgi:hypothetical protein